MTRLITKYTRFIGIMASYPREMAVPTLDVDLAWHTAQLTPGAYFRYTMDRAGKFIDHNDKVADVVLRDGFEMTSKRYQKLYREVYSECTCWYCEAMRETHASSLAGTLGLSTQSKSRSLTTLPSFPFLPSQSRGGNTNEVLSRLQSPTISIAPALRGAARPILARTCRRTTPSRWPLATGSRSGATPS